MMKASKLISIYERKTSKDRNGFRNALLSKLTKDQNRN